MTVGFFVAGKPAPQGSKNIGHNSRGDAYVYESSKYLKPWRECVHIVGLSHAKRAGWLAPVAKPIWVKIDLYFRRPASHVDPKTQRLRTTAPGWPTGAPDIDKCARAILDALTQVFFANDSFVVSLVAQKHWGDPGCQIQVTDEVQ